MNPWKASAQFAAFVWFTSTKQADTSEAARFAKENWIAFLPYADAGVGRLLVKIVRPRTATTTGAAERSRARVRSPTNADRQWRPKRRVVSRTASPAAREHNSSLM
jgi:hypothetical protein